MTDLATIQELSSACRHQECLQACQDALQTNSGETYAYKYAGKSLLALGQLEKAQKFLVKAYQLDGRDPEIVKDIGNIFNALQNDIQATRFYEASLSIDPNYAPAINNLGLIAKRQGNLVKAEQLVKKATELDQLFAPYHINLGGIYRDLGQLDQALASTLKSLDLKADNPNTYMNLGSIYKALGQLDQALASTLKSLELNPDSADAYMNLGGIHKEFGNLDQALTSTLKSLELKPNNPDALINLGGIYKELGNLDQALASTLKSLELRPDNADAYMNLGGIYKELGNLDQALSSTLKSLELKPDNADACMNLGGIYIELGQLDKALASMLKTLELKPDNADACMNLGGIYIELGLLGQALTSTLKSLELKPDNADAYMNLGEIYKELGNLDQALDSTLKSLELKPDNADALNNLKGFIGQLTLNSANTQNLMKAYELLINLDCISHSRLSNIFIQAFLPTIQEAAKYASIISAYNNALTNLAADWRLRKSLTLLIPPHQAIEDFLTRLRKELLGLAANQKNIPENLKGLTEALATQCFLNEYVYDQSPEEEQLVQQLISRARENQNTFNQYLAIIACYTSLHQLDLNKEFIESYPTSSYESKALIQTQLDEPREEKRIKASMQRELKATDAVSLKVQDMYEENPYPRYRYADFTDKLLATNISKAIRIESTKQNLQFSEVLTSNLSRPKILIAGCGTGKQVITSSRYNNALITAIDLSSSSLAYAIRKAKEYRMDNVDFRKMDLLDVEALDNTFDVIECGGVLHHMEVPAMGLSALNKQLKPGGYIKLGLYSDIARKDIVIARNYIKQLGLKSSACGIRSFRQKALRGVFKELENLLSYRGSFYSLSECRDLCFHVQEHRFTTRLIQELLAAEGLIFCGFMLPEGIRNNYQQQFPADTDMTSLENWGDFEMQNPTTFRAMYQFWACKPS